MPFNAKKTQSIYQLFLFQLCLKQFAEETVVHVVSVQSSQSDSLHQDFFVSPLFRLQSIHAKKKENNFIFKIAVLQRHSFAFSRRHLKPFWNNNISPCNLAPLTAWTSYKGRQSFLLKYQSFWVVLEDRWCKIESEPVLCPRNMTRN